MSLGALSGGGLDRLQTALSNMHLGTLDLNQLSNADLAALKKVLTPRMTEYIPHTPTPKQAAFMLLDCEEAFYGGAAGGGKLLKLDTPLLTDSGWKTVGTLLESDKIVALDGTWTEIEYITDVKRCPINYELTFSDGSKVTCNSDHLWTVEEVIQKNKNHRHYTSVETVTLTTQEILDIGLYTKKNNKMQRRWRLPEFKGLVGTQQVLPIDPYLLGYWLGDGTSSDGSFTIGTWDYDNFLEHISGRSVISCTPQNGSCYRVVLSDMYSDLRKSGLLQNKHIPVQYLLASREQRLELLRGLMDSDGHIQERGRAEWGQGLPHAQLFSEVAQLICSLGYKVSTIVAPSTYNGQLFQSLRLMFTPREKVVTLPRKVVRLLNTEPSRGDTAIWIDSAAQVEGGIPMKCIRIKHPSHVFMITEKFIPTHNSDALLMCALQYVDVQGYSAILFRKSYADLTKPGALMDRAKEWLLPFKNVRWDEKDKKFIFYKPGSKVPVSTLQFGYLENPNDRFNYQGGEYQFIGFDELTHIARTCYIYMFSRLRRLKGVNIPLRVRGASNPPEDDGGNWVRDRFIIEGPEKGRIFIPAGLDDNPYLDKEEYERTLEQLDPVSRARLRDGDWTIVRKGNMFKRDMFEVVDTLPTYRRTVRWWDMAASDEEKAAKKNKSGEPDYTASIKLSESAGIYYIEDIIRVRMTPEATDKLQHNTAVSDGFGVQICEEQEPGSSGIAVISNKSRGIFKGYAYKGVPSSGSKADRAQIASSAAGNGNIKVLRGVRNLEVFFDELESFPGGIHDDMVDCLSGAVAYLGTTSDVSAPPVVVKAEDHQVSTWLEDDDTEDGAQHSNLGYFSRFGM